MLMLRRRNSRNSSSDILAMSRSSTNTLAGSRLDEAVEQAHQRGFARSGEAHDDRDLAFKDLEGGVVDAQGVPGPANFGFVEALLDQLHGAARIIPKACRGS